jgi:hypothetical protein
VCILLCLQLFRSSLIGSFQHFQGSSNSTSDTLQQLQYHYIPLKWVAITFISFFGISTCTYAPLVLNRLLLIVELPEVVHVIQALYFRMWWLIPSAIFCGFLEVVGWSSRLWSSQNPFLSTPFIIQWVHFDGRLFGLLLMDVQSSNTCYCTHTASRSQFCSHGTHHPPARPSIQPSDS